MSGPIYFIGLDAYGNETSIPVPVFALITGRTGGELIMMTFSQYIYLIKCG